MKTCPDRLRESQTWLLHLQKHTFIGLCPLANNLKTHESGCQPCSHLPDLLPRLDSAPGSGWHCTSLYPVVQPGWPGRSELWRGPPAPPPWWSPAGPWTPSERTVCVDPEDRKRLTCAVRTAHDRSDEGSGWSCLVPGSPAALPALGQWTPGASAGLWWRTGCKSSSGPIHQSESLCLEENRQLQLENNSH